MVCKVDFNKAVKNHSYYIFFQIILGSFAESLRKFHKYYTKTSLRKTVIFTLIIWYL